MFNQRQFDMDKVVQDLDAWIAKQPNMKDSEGLPTIHPVLTARALLLMFLEREKEKL